MFANPLDAFTQSFQLVRGIQDDNAARRQAELQQIQQQNRQRDLQAAIQNLRINPSPEAMAEFGLAFPEMKDEMKAFFDTIDAGRAATLKGAARDVLIAQRGGGNVQAVFERYAAAAENSRDPETAKIFRDAAEVAKTNPDAAAQTAQVLLGFADQDAYKLFYDNSMYDTATIKELVAEGLQPGTPEFQQALRDKREGDPWVAVPGVGLFLRKDLESAAAGGQTEAIPSIPEGAVKLLIQNPNLRGDFDKKYGKGAADRILGGGSSNATGSFRGG